MNFSELLRIRRSVRDYRDDQVPVSVILEIIKETCCAPSAANRQPWQFVVVSGRDRLKRLSDESKANLLGELEKNPRSLLKNYEAALRNPTFNVFYNAPCLVYIGGPKTIRSLNLDCALAACYFMFSAAARGLGTCWVALGSDIRDPEFLKMMKIPDGFQFIAPLILGYPRSIPPVPDRAEPQIRSVVE
ncbi:MAG: nitroreductase family protein [Deltaproteobacteria bacterium]|nr:nitroreductase family protein [Deltaproteobacteria bacterium]